MTQEKFVLRKEHIKLLSNAYIGWDECEFGSPEIDCKKPFGNSHVHQDMITILGLEELKEGVYEFKLLGKKYLLKGEDKNNIYLEGADEQEMVRQLDTLYRELETALQIVLKTKSFKPGVYVSEQYGIEWKLMKGKDANN